MKRMKHLCQSLIAVATLTMIVAGTAQAADPWRNVTKKDGLPGDEIQFLKPDDGQVWIGTLSGLGVFKDGNYTVRLKNVQCWDLHKVGPDDYWVGTGTGVIRMTGERTASALAGETVAPIIAIDDTTLWALAKNRGTERTRLVQCIRGEWKAVEGLGDRNVTDLFKASDGRMWLSIEGNGVLVVDPKKGIAQATRHLEGTNVTAIMEDSKKRIWCGLWGKGVRVFDGTNWAVHLKDEKSYVFDIKEDKQHAIWVVTNQSGLHRFDGTHWTNTLKDEGPVNMLEVTSDGKVWVSGQTTGGLRYWDGKSWVVSLDSPLPIRCLLETKDHGIWAGGVLDGLHIRK